MCLLLPSLLAPRPLVPHLKRRTRKVLPHFGRGSFHSWHSVPHVAFHLRYFRTLSLIETVKGITEAGSRLGFRNFGSLALGLSYFDLLFLLVDRSALVSGSQRAARIDQGPIAMTTASPSTISPKFFRKLQCPLWVRSRHVQRKRACPLYPRKRHQKRRIGMSAKGQKRTNLLGHYSDYVAVSHDG